MRFKMSSPGIEPGPRPSHGRMRFRHTPRTISLLPVPRRGIEPRPAASNAAATTGILPVVPAGTLARHIELSVARPGIEPGPAASETAVRSTTLTGHMHRADDWICTSIVRFTKPAPFSFEPRRHCSCSARARGVEPRAAALETAGSPRSTLVYSPRGYPAPRLRLTITPPASHSSTPR